jgi:hypothetical protein
MVNELTEIGPVMLVLNVSALVVMLYALYRVNVLRKKVPGGVVRSSLNLMCELVALFTMGYIATLFFPILPQVSQNLLVGIMFFVLAIFVVIVIDLFYMIVSELGL